LADFPEIKKININSDLPVNGDNSSYGFLFKMFQSKDDFLKKEKKHYKFYTNQEHNQNFKKRTTNQLLIDTLLFKKENLSERGFLLVNKKDTRSKWSVGTKFSPVYSLADNIKQPVNQENTGALKSARNNERPDTKADEKSLMSFSGGFNVNYNFTRRWSIESGLFFSQHRQMADKLVGSSVEGLQDEMTVYTPEGVRYIQPNGVTDPGYSQVIGTTQDETYYSLNKMDYISNFEYLELPLLVRYKIIDKRFSLDVLSGISTNFLIGNKSSLVFKNNDLWSGASDGISPMLYNATFGLGLNYNIYQNFSLNIEPTFKYSIYPAETTILRYPYSFAVFTGFSYRF
jgi:hypothetical protein